MGNLIRKLQNRILQAALIAAFAVLFVHFQDEFKKEQEYRLLQMNQAADVTWEGKVIETVQTGQAGEDKEKIELHAISAALIDADSGRVLYGKNENEVRPMASTTKIMTCIVALEQAGLEEEVAVSAYAASRPKVKLYMKKGETYRLKDLLYSIMLESHNDSAAAIAEHIGSRMLGEQVTEATTSEESRRYLKEFAGLMNQKAQEIGCENTWFITPNGLDAAEETEVIKEDGNLETLKKVHSTTAKELALVLRYCVRQSAQKSAFLEITGTKSHSFSSLSKSPRSFSCQNHNAFLSMMDGAFTGKTGFTNNAGYCYVGALERDGRTYIVALLGCGWPNNKSYKWADTRALMNYGLENYEKKEVELAVHTPKVLIGNGVPSCGNFGCPCLSDTFVDFGSDTFTCLLSKEDSLSAKITLDPQFADGNYLYWKAPKDKNTQVGELDMVLNGESVKAYPVYLSDDVEEIKPLLCIKKVLRHFLLAFCG